MPNKQIFQFTLGPVQGFVAQARRTRDFWAGSFILSWLSSAAMAAIKAQGGAISFPTPDDHYLKWLHAEGDSQPPVQGSVPNRFKAMTASVPDSFEPQLISQAVQAAWLALADTVWKNDLEGLVGEATRSIWQRQVANFWEISWVLSDTEAGNLLDRRKNWRNPVASEEPGHKCMMMDGWQELSGVIVSHTTAVNQFWKGLSASGKPGIKTDLRGNEQLCAMAFIKRRFSRYFDQVKVVLPGVNKTIYGWHVPSAVPSVSFLAAAPWLAQCIEKAPIDTFARFAEEAQKLSSYSEAAHVSDHAFAIDIAGVSDAARRRSQQEPEFKRHWAGLDGQLYFPSVLQNPNAFGTDKDTQEQAGRVLNALNKLRVSTGLTALPSPFYAILLMDGDQLGSHMGDPSKQAPISQALNAFTADAGRIVRDHNGFLVYAGGDDVLALLPLEDALPAAQTLQRFYKHCFEQYTQGRVPSTLSAAIEFVHIRTPLTRVLQDAHQLLDQVAKDQTGRDALAVRVWKPSGLAAQWSMPWAKAIGEDGQLQIQQLASQFAGQTTEEAHFSSKFFFRAKQLIERFPNTQDQTLEKLLQAEYLHSFGSRAKAISEQGQDKLLRSLNTLLSQSRQWQRRLEAHGEIAFSAQGLNPDTVLLVRFLAHKGLERDTL